MNDEIVFGMGLDTTPFAAGLRSAKALAADAANEIKTSFQNGLKEAFAPLLGAFAVTGLAESVKGIAEFGKQIKLTAEEAGVNTDFIQGLASASHKLGIDAETSAASLSVLSRKIGEARTEGGAAAEVFQRWGIAIEGLNTEQIFYEIADKMHEITDPAQRSAMAFDLMGKGAKEMAAALPIGADAMKSLVENASKLSSGELEKLDAIDAKLEELGRKWKIIWGGIVTSVSGIQTPAGNLSEEAITKKMEELNPKYKPSKRKQTVSEQWLDSPPKETTDLRDQAIESLKKEQEPQTKPAGFKTPDNTKAIADVEKQLAAQRERDQMREADLDERILLLNVKLGKQIVQQEAMKKGSLDYAQQELTIDQTAAQLHDTERQADLQHQDDMQKAIIATHNLQAQIDNLDWQAKKMLQGSGDKDQSKNRLSIQELADSKFRMTGTLGDDQRKAREYMQVDKLREQDVKSGHYDRADSRSKYMKELAGTMSDNVPDLERFPDRDLKQNLQHIGDERGKLQDKENTANQELLKLAQVGGLKVTVVKMELAP